MSFDYWLDLADYMAIYMPIDTFILLYLEDRKKARIPSAHFWASMLFFIKATGYQIVFSIGVITLEEIVNEIDDLVFGVKE